MSGHPKSGEKLAEAPRVEWAEEADGVVSARIQGELTFLAGEALWVALHPTPTPTVAARVRFDLSGLRSVDGGAMALLVQTKWDLEAAGVAAEFAGATGAVQKILALYEGDASPAPEPASVRVGWFGRVGNTAVLGLRELQLLFAFVGSLFLATAGVLRRPRTANWRDIPPIMARTGSDAVPIVLLIIFLVGFVMAFQAAAQLKRFGANLYVADLVALSITRELGPLMTAIVAAGRSGAAFTAELGTMRVSEEIDALRTMGIGPLRFLVFPRVVSLVLVLPVLTLMGDLLGILGGLAVGVVSLDLTIVGYLNQTQRSLGLWDVGQGLIKAGVFGLTIGLIACAQGLATTGGAAGVGRRTTTSVVSALFSLIILDAAFTVAFHELGL